MSARGVYVVAYGDPARRCALRLIASIRKHMPALPVALAGVDPLGPEDVFVPIADNDVGARRAKLCAYTATPAEWQSVLYLDADTELVAPVHPLFQWIEDGWEFVICRDVKETLHWFQRKNNLDEFRHLYRTIGTLWALQFNGGVWAFRRCSEVERFFTRWRDEYEVYVQRDQGALVRALYAEPLRILTLCNEWNHCGPKYTPDCERSAVMHYPGDARRWVGKIPGRLDAPEARAIVKRFEATHR